MGSDFYFNSYKYSITAVRVIMYIRLRCVSNNMLSTTCSVPIIVDVGKREAHRQLIGPYKYMVKPEEAAPVTGTIP